MERSHGRLAQRLKHSQHKELQEILRRAIQRLPLKLREVLILRDIEEHSVKETARKLGISISTTKARLLRALLKLKMLWPMVELRSSIGGTFVF
jgi:RNA polymerase sigma factor (sigma-70 family)